MSKSFPVLAQDIEESARLRDRFSEICDGDIVGLVGASVTGTLAEDGGILDLRMANEVRLAVDGFVRMFPPSVGVATWERNR